MIDDAVFKKSCMPSDVMSMMCDSHVIHLE